MTSTGGDPEPVFRCRIASRIGEIPGAREALITWATLQGAPRAAARSVALILDELVTNTIQHGYQGQPCGAIAVEASLEDGAIAVQLTDQARPFDPLSLQPPDMDADIEQRSIGGLGILFVRRLTDELSYRLLDAGGPGQANQVRFVKRFKLDPGTPEPHS